MAKKPVKKIDERKIPQKILSKVKQIKNRYYKEEDKNKFLKIYWKNYDEVKDNPKHKEFSEIILHKKTIAKIKNDNKREKIGGTIDKYYKIVLGMSKIRDLNDTKRSEIIKKYTEDPDGAMEEGLIMRRYETNPVTNEEDKIPILDDDGQIIPRDNREYFINANGSRRKNTNFDHALQHLLRRNVVGICINPKGLIGVFIEEIRDEQTNLKIPRHKLLKSSSKTMRSTVEVMKENKYINVEMLEDMIDTIEDELENGLITKSYVDMVKQYYNRLINNDDFETNLFFLRSSTKSYFDVVIDKEDLEACKNLLDEDGMLNINKLYKEYMYPFTSDCSNLLNYHNSNKEIVKVDNRNKPVVDKEGNTIIETNWNEFVCFQDVNLLQMNTEASVSGNITMYVDDESLSNNEVQHLDKIIESIKIMVPSSIHLDFGQDSKVNLIGSPFQFPAKDEENKELYEEAYDDEGNILKDENGDPVQIPILDYPSIMVYGIYPIEEYKVHIDTIDMTSEDGKLNNKKIEKESDDLTEEEIKDMEEAIKKNNQLDDIEEESEEEPEEESEEEPEEDKIIDVELW